MGLVTIYFNPDEVSFSLGSTNMRIVIIGSGKVGYQIATSLSREKHDIVVVDTDQEVLNRLNENIDVLTIREMV